MRRPPSAGCLFGQTGCLTAQAVDGILMDMTNDSLSPFSLSADSFLLDSLLSPLLLPAPSMRMKLSSLGFSCDSRDGCDMNTFSLFFFFFFKCTCVASGRTFSTSGLFVEHTPTRLIPVPNHLLVGGHKTNPLVPVTIEWARLILSLHPSEVFNFPDHTFFFFFPQNAPRGGTGRLSQSCRNSPLGQIKTC